MNEWTWLINIFIGVAIVQAIDKGVERILSQLSEVAELSRKQLGYYD